MSKSSSLLNQVKTPEFYNFPETEAASQSDDIENSMSMSQVMMVHFEEYVKVMVEEKQISK